MIARELLFNMCTEKIYKIITSRHSVEGFINSHFLSFKGPRRMSTIKLYYSLEFFGHHRKSIRAIYFLKILYKKRHNEHLLCFLSLFPLFLKSQLLKELQKNYFLNSRASGARLSSNCNFSFRTPHAIWQ